MERTFANALRVCLLWPVLHTYVHTKNSRNSSNFWRLFPTVKSYALILSKNGLGSILDDFSQTYLVTLLEALVSRGHSIEVALMAKDCQLHYPDLFKK
jgi:hypothetical protein